MPTRNGQAKAIEEERERQREQQLHQTNLNGAEPTKQDIYESVLEDIVDTSLQEGSKNMLKNLLTRDFVLAYLTEAEVTEFKWKLRAKRELFYAMHPAEECVIIGELRSQINDDPHDHLRPLSDMQRWEVDNVFDGVWMRVTRAKGMKQQEMLNTQIRESKVDRGEKTSSGGIVGKIKR